MHLISFFLKRYVNKHSKIKTVLSIRNFKSLNRNIFANVYIYTKDCYLQQVSILQKLCTWIHVVCFQS